MVSGSADINAISIQGNHLTDIIVHVPALGEATAAESIGTASTETISLSPCFYDIHEFARQIANMAMIMKGTSFKGGLCDSFVDYLIFAAMNWSAR